MGKVVTILMKFRKTVGTAKDVKTMLNLVKRYSLAHITLHIRIVCCPKQTGALKRTTAPTRYMHVVCAQWSKNIDSEDEPYNFNNQDLDKYTCYICKKKQGLCVQCEHSGCTRNFHITCALNQSLLKPSKNIPEDYQLLCSSHATVKEEESSDDDLGSVRSKSRSNSRPKKLQARGRKVESDDDEDEDDDDNSKQDSDESEASEKAQSTASSDMSLDTEKSGSLTPHRLPAKKRKLTPNNRRNGDLDLFKDDHSESNDDEDDDDDLGTRGSSSNKSANNGHRNSLVAAAKSMSLQEMMRNKRKRADMEKSKGLQGLKPANTGLSMDNAVTTTNKPVVPPAASSTTQAPVKNKLPKNGMGLASNPGLGLATNRPNTSSPGPTQPVTTATLKKPSISAASGGNAPAPLDFDTLQNDIRGGAHKWGAGGQAAPPALLSPGSNQTMADIINTPGSNPGTPRFGENNKKLQLGASVRKSDSPAAADYSDLVGTMKGTIQDMMEGMLTKLQSSQITSNGAAAPNPDQLNQIIHLQTQLRSAESEIYRLREQQRAEIESCKRESDRTHRQFKANVLAIFEALGCKIPGMQASPENIEEYVQELRNLVVSAKVDERERDRVLQKVLAEVDNIV
ncbi:hypothetical protein INT43_001365 [Umbelopsis isabellina]|uniref:PHD-type domain-containing protein n=1 Tax=Mortierella isabellina TaxID=91625 RepID=A0A8H7UDA8_MORIS|nr:hypothetical protein INT43_001365 [Umbelopsis isabellina]